LGFTFFGGDVIQYKKFSFTFLGLLTGPWAPIKWVNFLTQAFLGD